MEEQVEGLCAMVDAVEDLVAKAERHCSTMQVWQSVVHYMIFFASSGNHSYT